jgi:hypothetical protein
MRFPNETFPNAVQPVDATDVTAKAAVGAVRRIGDGTRGSSAQAGGHHAVEEAGARHEDLLRVGEDRRVLCRRIYHLPVLLDTRSGEDRRKETRRPDDVATHIAEDI